MNLLKKVLVPLFVLVMIAGCFPARSAQATTKPGKAKVIAKVNDDGTSVTLTIAKTKNAQGYKIMVKKPGASKFTKLTTLKKDGTAERTYTAKKLTAGEYQFKVRAYLKNGSKTVWGKYSKVSSVKVSASKEDGAAKKKETMEDWAGSYVTDDGGSMSVVYNAEKEILAFQIIGFHEDDKSISYFAVEKKYALKERDTSLSGFFNYAAEDDMTANIIWGAGEDIYQFVVSFNPDGTIGISKVMGIAGRLVDQNTFKNK